MTLWQTALFLLCVALASCAQSLSGFAFALILLGLAGLFELAPLADLANVATVLALVNARSPCAERAKHWTCRLFVIFP